MTIRYKDVSHYNGAYRPTGPTCAKATEGAGFTDPEFAGIRSRTLAGGWPFLAYHFLDHGNIAAQVAHVIKVIASGQPLMLDVESEPGQPDPTLTDVYAFADSYARLSGGGRVTLAYIPQWYWAGHIGHPVLTGLADRGIGLVSSNPYVATYTDNGPGWAEYSTTQHGITFHAGVKPIIWQYTSTPLDTNAFKGTQAQLADLWANGTDNTHPSAPVEEDMPLTQADADLVASTLLGRLLGNSGPVVAVALQSTYNTVKALSAALEPTALAAIVAQAVHTAGVDVPVADLQTALVGALREFAAQAPQETV